MASILPFPSTDGRERPCVPAAVLFARAQGLSLLFLPFLYRCHCEPGRPVACMPAVVLFSCSSPFVVQSNPFFTNINISVAIYTRMSRTPWQKLFNIYNLEVINTAFFYRSYDLKTCSLSWAYEYNGCVRSR